MTEAEDADETITPQQLVTRLIELLDVEELDRNLYRGGRSRENWRRVFGGQVVAQALMAACRTVEAGRRPHSLHAYFMRPGDPARPIVFEVFCDRDGKSFTSRRVVAIQGGKPILNLAASFQVREDGLRHQSQMPDVPPPEGLIDEREIVAQMIDKFPERRRALMLAPRAIEFRAVYPGLRYSPEPAAAQQYYWFRAVAPVPEDQLLNRVMLAYASDMLLLSTSTLPHGVGWDVDHIQEASIDHAIWLHDDLKMDEWMLYAQDSPWAGGARGMNRGQIFRRDGVLVASVAQEGLIRVRP